MAIIIDENSRVIIQGITGGTGRGMAARMSEKYNTLVGGVTPGKGGMEVCGKPVFNFVHEAVEAVGANTSAIVVPAKLVKGAFMEAVDAGIKTIWVYTDDIPLYDTVEMVQYAKMHGVRFIGPNSAGCVSPEKGSIADYNEDTLPMPQGHIGVVSKSGSLNSEAVDMLARAGYGFSTIVTLGGEAIGGTSFQDVLPLFRDDPQTEAVVMISEVGGTDEAACRDIIKDFGKPIIAYISGHTAPPKKRMGHAGAIAGSEAESAAAKTRILREVGVPVADYIEEIPELMKKVYHP